MAGWYNQDDASTSTTPDSTDFYFFSSDNRLEKVIYDVTKDDSGGDAPVDVTAIHWQNIADNKITHSDQVIYARRDTGTRSRVNWYRGSADKTDAIPGGFAEDNTAPDQKTHYDTSDDPGADADNPAADGEGSRDNYTAIGQVGYTWDNNRNLLADGTREFRYNYRNELRKVWRKSDGENMGRVAEYREDPFGRRVLEWTWWKTAR